jgi:hypothetical protein
MCFNGNVSDLWPSEFRLLDFVVIGLCDTTLDRRIGEHCPSLLG